MLIKTQTKESDDLWYFKPVQPWHEPGRIIELVFRTPNQLEEESALPAVILNTIMHHNRPPSHDVGFFTSWLSGEVSGMLTIKSMMPSRYMLKNVDIPERVWKLFEGFECEEYDITPEMLFFVKNISDTERQLIYPFRD